MASSHKSTYQFRAKLWRWNGGKTSWFFVTLPVGVSKEIKLVDAGPKRLGFGSLRVEATIGGSTWQTSIFPATKLKGYLLPVKASVRKAEKMIEDKTVAVQVVVNRAW
jgi:hypothetical protein